MVRRARRLVLVLLIGVAATGCGDDGDERGGPLTTAADRTPATLPEDIERGRGALVLDGSAAVLDVTVCALEPTTDPATGVTTELVVVAEDGTGLTVDVFRSSFDADVPSVTDTVRVVDEEGTVLESSRVDRDGLQIDLRVANPAGSLLDVDLEGGIVRAEGVFGPEGGTAEDPANVDGELVLRCP